MDSKLEAHIDEIFIDVPKTDKMVTMINRIKSKANSKFLQIRDQGYSRSVAFNEVDDWLMKAKVIVDEEAGKLTPAELATIKTPATPYNAPAGEVVSNASLDDGEAAVVVERDYDAPAFEAAPVQYDTAVDMSYAQETEPESFASEPAPAEEATAVEPAAEKPAKEKTQERQKEEERRSRGRRHCRSRQIVGRRRQSHRQHLSCRRYCPCRCRRTYDCRHNLTIFFTKDKDGTQIACRLNFVI